MEITRIGGAVCDSCARWNPPIPDATARAPCTGSAPKSLAERDFSLDRRVELSDGLATLSARAICFPDDR
jgi:hypothetical protein